MLYPAHRELLKEELPKDKLESFLLQRTKEEGRLIRKKNYKIKKSTKTYKAAADALTPELLEGMKKMFSQVKVFCRHDVYLAFDEKDHLAWKSMHMQPLYRMNPFITVEGNGTG